MVLIMGMQFNKEEAPDFGSIRLVNTNENYTKSYLLNSEDVPKLELITNAEDGSIAYCVDTAELYIKHIGKWNEVV
jgi:hypothetical protein